VFFFFFYKVENNWNDILRNTSMYLVLKFKSVRKKDYKVSKAAKKAQVIK
jgi:hypothetical protein